MQLKLMTAVFDEPSLGAHSTRTDSGNVLSVLFDQLLANSQASDLDSAPQLQRAEGIVQCEGQGWVSVLVRGSVIVAGAHGYAHLTGWANGRRLREAARVADEPFCEAVLAPVAADGQLRISLLLLAQRDLTSSDSGAMCVVDSVDIAVLPPQRLHAAGAKDGNTRRGAQ